MSSISIHCLYVFILNCLWIYQIEQINVRLFDTSKAAGIVGFSIVFLTG